MWARCCPVTSPRCVTARWSAPPAVPGSAMPASARIPSPSPTGTSSTPCASSRATSRGWRAWSRPRPGNGTRPTPGRWWRSPSPDNVLVSGQLASGAVASVHAAAVPWAGSGFRMEIYGREGTLVATGTVSSQRGETLRLQGARGDHALSDLEVPERFVYVPADFPRGDPFNVGQMYALFAEAIRTGQTARRRSTPRWTCTASSIPSSRRRIRAGSYRSPEALRAPVDNRRRVSTTHRRGSCPEALEKISRIRRNSFTICPGSAHPPVPFAKLLHRVATGTVLLLGLDAQVVPMPLAGAGS